VVYSCNCFAWSFRAMAASPNVIVILVDDMGWMDSSTKWPDNTTVPPRSGRFESDP
jgi:hypothetical protein